MELSLRKTPRQARSSAMVEAILEAAARVLAREGLARATTNRIAEVAGVSIGSLYQYFPNKMAIVQALQQAHGQAMVDLVRELAPAASRLSLEQAVRLMTDSILDGHLAVERLHREILSPALSGMAAAGGGNIREGMVGGLRDMLDGHRDVIAAPSVDLAAAFTYQIVLSLTHGAIDLPQQYPPTLVGREMPRVVVRYLVAGS